ncbi:MAG: hypothetical protein ACTHOC_06385 [Luteimonas sp.]
MTCKPTRLAATFLLAVALLACRDAVALTANAASAAPVAAADATPPLRSRAALEAWLAAEAGQRTPLDLLPPLARARFIDDLVFGHDGLGGFSTEDLATELTPAEAKAVLALFDAADYAAAVHSRNPSGPPSWRGAPGAPGPAVLAYDALHRFDREHRGDAAGLRTRFDTLVAPLADPARFDGLPERELVYLLRSFSVATFGQVEPEDADRLRALVTAMERRGLARAPDFRLAYDRLLSARRFDAARAFADAHPDAGLPATPRFADPGGNAPAISFWRPDADGTTLVRTAFDAAPLQLVVTAGCHISEDAAGDITSDPLLGPVFAAHAHWMMQSPGTEDQAAVRDWNQRFPGAQARQIYDRGEWTMLPPGWSMPTFYVVRDGRVIDELVGWKRGGDRRDALVAMLRRHGLLPSM